MTSKRGKSLVKAKTTAPDFATSSSTQETNLARQPFSIGLWSTTHPFRYRRCWRRQGLPMRTTTPEPTTPSPKSEDSCALYILSGVSSFHRVVQATMAIVDSCSTSLIYTISHADRFAARNDSDKEVSTVCINVPTDGLEYFLKHVVSQCSVRDSLCYSR